MSCSNLRVDAHVLLAIGSFYLRCDRSGLSMATHMDSEAPIRTVLTDQDDSRLGFQRRARTGSFVSSNDPNSFLSAVQHVSCVIHAPLGRVVKKQKSNTLSSNRTNKDKLFSKWTRRWFTCAVMFIVLSLQTLCVLHPFRPKQRLLVF